jgi:LEA14-like dessication related protein
MKFSFITSLLTMVMVLTGCAGLQNAVLEEPVVTLTSINTSPSEGIAPKFNIGLHIVNPNSVSLPIKGITYSVEIEEQRVLVGASNQTPTIEAYSEADINLTAQADLLSSVKLIALLMQRQKSDVSYTLNAKLDIGSLLPAIQIKKQGELSFIPDEQ